VILAMGIKEEGENLIKNHDILFNELVKIPKERPMYYREDLEKGLLIGKPRFEEKKLKWTVPILKEFHNHLQNLWDFFDKYSYWFDQSTKLMLTFEDRSISNKSIKFLLERDVWNTSEVYGAYLIENKVNKTLISYYRFDSRVKTFEFPFLEYDQREKWIKNDALQQIINQFTFLWDSLRTEIEVCIQEEYHKFPPVKLKNDYIQNQLEIANSIIKTNPEGSLLMLGRISELWLLKAMGLTSTNKHWLVSEAKKKKIIRNVDALFFSQLRYHYNKLKHSIDYDIRSCPLMEYIEKFRLFLNESTS
jgi:hypothetical protein